MSWRTVVVATRSKLELRLNYLICRGEQEKRIHLSEISFLVVESTAVSITSALLSELINRKIKVIFCDSQHNPQAELVPFYGCHDVSNKIREQIEWNEDRKREVATAIIYDKILKQRNLLKKKGYEEYQMLDTYLNEIQLGDLTNREGHAAKVYFNALFSQNFSRGNNGSINSALNYGYAIILSAFNREIICNGYLTQIGINHKNSHNFYNLASDLMEPYRILIDNIVVENLDKEFNNEYKHALIDVLNMKVKIGGENHYVANAIKKYSKSVFDALEGESLNQIHFYYEL